MNIKNLHEILDLFEKEFWKDKREIEVCAKTNSLIKHYDNSFEQKVESSVMDYLRTHGIVVPQVLSINPLSTQMSYHKGIRVFNFLVAIDKFARIDCYKANMLKKQMLSKCLIEQRKIQQLLVDWNNEYKMVSEPYSIDKLSTVITLLSKCLDIKYDTYEMLQEQNRFYEYWKSTVAVPFRDATTKNMIIESEEFFLQNFESEDQRNSYLMDLFAKEDIDRFLKLPIVNVDFSSCVNLTTIEDDIIGFCFHERTWNKQYNFFDESADAYRISMSFIMRFLRFGGRKASYKVLHKDAFDVRFKYDNPLFYFSHLPLFASRYAHDIEIEYREMFGFIKNVEKCLEKLNIEKDYFAEFGQTKGENIYVDVFPF